MGVIERYQRMFLIGFASGMGALVALAFLAPACTLCTPGWRRAEVAVFGLASVQALRCAVAGAFMLLALALLLFMLVKVQCPTRSGTYTILRGAQLRLCCVTWQPLLWWAARRLQAQRLVGLEVSEGHECHRSECRILRQFIH